MIIDVSSNNGVLDWADLRLNGVTEAIIRLSLGYGQIDKMAIQNAKEANKNGINVSYYHLAYPDAKTGGTVVGDARAEAEYFTEKIKSLGVSMRRVALDLEDLPGGADRILSPAQYCTWVATWLQHVECKTGSSPLVYSYANYLDTRLPVGHELGHYPLWIASYANVQKPVLPKGWDRYALWQYTNKAKIGKAKCDFDVSKY